MGCKSFETVLGTNPKASSAVKTKTFFSSPFLDSDEVGNQRVFRKHTPDERRKPEVPDQ